MNLWTVGCADPRLTAQARSPMDKPGKTLCVSPTLPTGRRLPTSFTAPQQHQGLILIPGKVPLQPATGLSLFFPEPVQTTGTVADATRARLAPGRPLAQHKLDPTTLQPRLPNRHNT